MPRVLPTMVLEVIDKTFPAPERQFQAHDVYASLAPELSAIVRLVDAIPMELLPVGKDYCDLIRGLEFLREAIARWHARGTGDAARSVNGVNPITLIRRIIARCPDSRSSPDTAELTFIDDEALRESIRMDISTATTSFHNAEWKGATVLAGSAAEALLLWSINKKPKSELQAISSKPTQPLERWDLADYIDVAEKLEIIGKETAIQARLAKEFRNLIHPGRERRTGQACNKATAYTALAAVEHIVWDLTPR